MKNSSTSKTSKKKTPLPDVEILNSKAVTYLFIALNVFGYDDENNPRGMHPKRRMVRKELDFSNLRKKYKKLGMLLREEHPWTLIRSQFERTSKLSRSLRKELSVFAIEPSVARVSQEVLSHQGNKSLLHYISHDTKELFNFIGYSSKGPTSICVIENLLDLYWRGYSFSIGRKGYIVIGPGWQKNHRELIRHELLHFIEPFIKEDKISKSVSSDAVKLGYGNKKVSQSETIVRALNLLFEQKVLRKSISKAIAREINVFPSLEKTVNLLRQRKEKGPLF